MFLNVYSAYTLRMHSEIECPELPLHPEQSGDPDVIVRLLPPVPSVTESLGNGYYEVSEGIFRMSVAGVAHYLVESGNCITIEPQSGASPEEVRLFLLGSSMGALLYQRGLFPLHGSAVETQWGSMIFVGAQGIGKSTLAAEFHRQGYRLLSDDVCALSPTAEGLDVLPALSHFRLCADAYERIGNPRDAHFNVDKYVVPMGEGRCSYPVPLKAIHILADQADGDPRFEIIRGFDRVKYLLENLYRPHYLKGQKTQFDLMKLAGEIAQKATIASVTRRRDPETIGELIPFLESEWTNHFGRMPVEVKT